MRLQLDNGKCMRLLPVFALVILVVPGLASRAGKMQAGRNDSWQLGLIKDKSERPVGTVLVDVTNPPDLKMPWLCYLTFHYQHRPLPTSAEFDRFDDIDKTIQNLCKDHKARNVGIWMQNGKRDWIVYAKDGHHFAEVSTKALAKLGLNVNVQLDRNWSQYRTLRTILAKNPAQKPG